MRHEELLQLSHSAVELISNRSRYLLFKLSVNGAHCFPILLMSLTITCFMDTETLLVSVCV